jgi:hypothetical protein
MGIPAQETFLTLFIFWLSKLCYCFVVSYALRGLIAISFVYMHKADEARKNLQDLYNNLPDGVIVLKAFKTPQTEYTDSIVAGDVGATHY